jgi:beta-glucosidase
MANMTLEEKIGQMLNPTFAPDENGIPPETVKNWIQNFKAGFLLMQYVPDAEKAAKCTNQIQEWAMANPQKIPVIINMDSVHGACFVGGATIYPYGIGLAAGGDLELIEKLAQVTAEESRAVGVHQSLSPLADISTEPRWGRVYENAGESSEFSVKMVEAQIRGLQGDSISNTSVIATTKHFPGAGPEKDGKDPLDISPENLINYMKGTIVSNWESLWSTHLPPFQKAIEMKSAAIMPYYSIPQAIDTVPALASEKTIIGLLRGTLGYDGLVHSDWNPVTTVMVYGYDMLTATKMVVNAGNDVIGHDQTSESTEVHLANIDLLVRTGQISEDRINDAVSRILKLKIQLGMFDNPFVDPKNAKKIVGCAEHQELSLEAAKKSIILMKNYGVLPISNGTNILVAGVRADEMEGLCGGWTGYPQPGLTLLGAIRAKASPDSNVYYEASNAANAAELAKKCGVAIVHVGEGAYIHNLGFPIGDFNGKDQLELLQADVDLINGIRGTGIPTIVVMTLARPYIISSWCETVSAVIGAPYPGTQGGIAIADVIFGNYAPTGKLPFNMPKSMDDVLNARSDLPFDAQEVTYSFGSGLTYESASDGESKSGSGFIPGFEVIALICAILCSLIVLKNRRW